MFEAHADMLCKRNQVCFGHKVCLAFGKTGVVLATDILRGNPAGVTGHRLGGEQACIGCQSCGPAS